MITPAPAIPARVRTIHTALLGSPARDSAVESIGKSSSATAVSGGSTTQSGSSRSINLSPSLPSPSSQISRLAFTVSEITARKILSSSDALTVSITISLSSNHQNCLTYY